MGETETSREIGKMWIPLNWLVIAMLVFLVIHAIFSFRQWRHMEDVVGSLRLAQRAWLATIQNQKMGEFVAGERPNCVITFRNTGNTVAHVIRSNITVTTLPANNDISAIDDHERAEAENLPSINSVPPNGVYFAVDAHSDVLTDALIKQIKNGERKLVVFGSCFYRDVIENRVRTTQYCFIWAPSTRELYPHNKGNYMD